MWDGRASSIPFFLMLTDLCCLFHKVMVLAELFLEMLQRDFGYRIYKMLLSLPEKVVAPPEPEKEEAAKEEETVKEEAAKEPKDEVQSEGTAAESDAPPVSTSAACTGSGAARGVPSGSGRRWGPRGAPLTACMHPVPLPHGRTARSWCARRGEAGLEAWPTAPCLEDRRFGNLMVN